MKGHLGAFQAGEGEGADFVEEERGRRGGGVVRGGERGCRRGCKRGVGEARGAGEGAVDKYKGVPPYLETQMYVEKILHRYNSLRK